MTLFTPWTSYLRRVVCTYFETLKLKFEWTGSQIDNLYFKKLTASTVQCAKNNLNLCMKIRPVKVAPVGHVRCIQNPACQGCASRTCEVYSKPSLSRLRQSDMWGVFKIKCNLQIYFLLVQHCKVFWPNNNFT